MNFTDEPSFRTRDVLKMCSGASMRQVQWWIQRRLVSPRQDGHVFLWSTKDAVQLGLLAHLRLHAQLSLFRARKVLALVRRELPYEIERWSGKPLYLLIAAKRCTLMDERDEVLRRACAERGPVVIVALSDIIRKISENKEK